MNMNTKMTRLTVILAAAVLLSGLAVGADAPPAPAASAPTASPSVLGGSTVIKDAAAPTAEELAKGDPAGDHHRHGGGHRRGRRQEGPDDRRRRQPGRPEQDRHQLRLDAGHRLPGHVHAGRIRHRRNRPVPRQERQPHHDDELHGVRRRHARLLADRLRHPDGRRRRGGQPGRHARRSATSSPSRCSASPWGLFGQQRLLPDARRHL